MRKTLTARRRRAENFGGFAVANAIPDVANLQAMVTFLKFFAPAALLDILGAHSDPSQPPTHRPVHRNRNSVLRRYYRWQSGVTESCPPPIVLKYFTLLHNSWPRSLSLQGTVRKPILLYVHCIFLNPSPSSTNVKYSAM